MSDPQPLDRKEISRRIILGVGLVYDVLNELDQLLRMIFEDLKRSLESDDIRRKFFTMPVPRGKARTPADASLPLDRGFVLALGVAAEEDEEDEEEDEDVGDDEEDTASEKRGLQISPDSQFLVVRTILYDRNGVNNNEFEPVVVGATMANMRRVPKGKGAKRHEGDTSFLVKYRGNVLQLAKKLDHRTSGGQPLAFRFGKYELVWTVGKVVSRPLAEFDSEENVKTFVEQLLQIAEPAAE